MDAKGVTEARIRVFRGFLRQLRMYADVPRAWVVSAETAVLLLEKNLEARPGPGQCQMCGFGAKGTGGMCGPCVYLYKGDVTSVSFV